MAGLLEFLQNYTDIEGNHALGQFIRSSPGYQQQNMQGPPPLRSPAGWEMYKAQQEHKFTNSLRQMSNERLLAEYRQFLHAAQVQQGPNISILQMPLRVLESELTNRGLVKGMQPQE